MSWCSRCVGIHGNGCVACYRDEAGRELCVFCYDGLVCPIQKRILTTAKAAGATTIPAKSVIGTPTAHSTIALAGELLRRRRIVGSTATAESEDDTMAGAIRMCSEPGCDKKLANNNTTGKCQAHGGGSHRATPTEHGTCTTHGGGTQLAHNNSSRKCRVHGGDEGNAKPAHSCSPEVHSVPVNGGNGSRHGDGHDLDMEARVELVMTKIPLAEKLAFISRWLSGEA